MDQWVTVLSTNESRYSLNTDSRCMFILERTRGPPPTSNVRKIDNSSGGSLMVWAYIMLDGRTPLHASKRGSVLERIDQVCKFS
ncbi:transposable element Tcb2 transposase [Trichonephila clavipes]|nr:transposable element Tcb2 transposase [Trichonephila clavipes]